MKCLMLALFTFMMLVCSSIGLPINWQLSLEVGSDKHYKMSPGKGQYDYVTFQDFTDVNNEVITNLERVKHVKSSLEANGRSDAIMRWLTLGGLVVTGLVGLVLKLKDIQKMVTKTPRPSVQIPMAVPQMTRSSSVPTAPINYFGAASF